MVLEEDGTDGDGIPADAVVVEGDVEGGGSGGIGGGACWKDIIAWLCRSGAIGIGGRREEGAAPAAEASETDEISLHSIEEEFIGLTRSSSAGGRGGGGGGTGTALVRMPCCGGGRITPLLLTRTCASTVMGAADPGSVLESLWQSETLPSAALLRTDCGCRTGGGGGGARR